MTLSLTLRFAGPQQSWSSNNVLNRNTEPVPTRTGILGMLGAAHGVKRGQALSWFNELVIWVRVEKPGRLATDFHTITPPSPPVGASRTRHKILTRPETHAAGVIDGSFIVPDARGQKWKPMNTGKVPSVISERAYLADAEFIAAVSHPDDNRVLELEASTRNPEFMTYLGRKAFAAAFPFHLGVRNGTPEQVLSALPTSQNRSTGLPVHKITSYRNPAAGRVTPPVVPTDTLWKAWATA